MTAALLEFPQLGRVARTWTVYGESPVSAHAALALLDAGLQPGPIDHTPYNVIKSTLSNWLDTMTAGASCFDLRMQYSEPNEGGVLLELWPMHNAHTSMRQRRVGPRLAQAEQLRGLGQSALVLLERASKCALPILLPQTLWQLAGNRRHLQEALHRYPRWALQPERPLARPALEGLANPHRTRFTGKLARALVGLDDALQTSGSIDYPRVTRLTSWPLALTWEAPSWANAYTTILDDHRHRMNRESAPIARLHVAPDEHFAETIRDFLAYFKPMGKVLQAVARVVYELVDPRAA